MPDERVLVAHLLRRTGFGPLPGQVDGLAPSGIDVAIDTVLAAPALDPGEPPLRDENNDKDYDAPVRHWLGLMAKAEAGLHEKMVWFWHGHLTSSYDKVGFWKMMWQQQQLLREYALGNFRDLVQAITIDPAMLVYLDGAESTAEAPNENYGRELMELFTLGRGNYSQDDVRAAAKALAGWTVDYDTGTASFVPESGNPTPVTYLGRSDVVHADDVVNAACDNPACAPFIAGKIHRFFTGVDPDPGRRAELASIFASSRLEIRPVVEAVLRHPSFLEQRLNRPRYPVEWVTAAVAALGIDDRQVPYDACSSLNQTPFYPPNVAGWPGGARWLAPSYALARAGVALQAPGIREVRDASDPVAAALARCSVYEVSETTSSALKSVVEGIPPDADTEGRAAVLLAAVTSSPEFALA